MQCETRVESGMVENCRGHMEKILPAAVFVFYTLTVSFQQKCKADWVYRSRFVHQTVHACQCDFREWGCTLVRYDSRWLLFPLYIHAAHPISLKEEDLVCCHKLFLLLIMSSLGMGLLADMWAGTAASEEGSYTKQCQTHLLFYLSKSNMLCGDSFCGKTECCFK